jgi:hypothetical protein
MINRACRFRLCPVLICFLWSSYDLQAVQYSAIACTGDETAQRQS